MKVISLGMGVQSTALYYMSSIGEIERADYAIFADTGGEKMATIDYYHKLIKWQKANNGIPIKKVQHKNLYKDLLNQQNSSGNRFASIPAFSENKTGMLRRQCTAEYKIQPVDKMIREIYGLIPHQRFPKTEVWYGITLEEMRRMAIPQQKWKINVYPFVGYKIEFGCITTKISDHKIRRAGLVQWYIDNDLDIPVKSSCVFCPFQSDVNWLRLKRTCLKDFKNAIKIDKAIRDSSKRGIKERIYLHRSCKPLSEVQFDEQQTDFWGECSGNCHL